MAYRRFSISTKGPTRDASWNPRVLCLGSRFPEVPAVDSYAVQLLIGWFMREIIEGSEEPDRRAWHALLAAQVMAIAAVGCYCAWSQRYLYADGAGFFLSLLQNRDVADWFPARQFAHLLTQYPAVFLVRSLGCRDVNLIGQTYGATLFLLPTVGLLLTWWAARKAPGQFLVFPMLSHAILFLDTSFVIFCETHVAVMLFWPVLYLLLYCNPLTVLRSALLLGLTILATHTYESYLFLVWPLMFAVVRRGRTAWMERRYGEVLTCAVCGLALLNSFAVALHSTIIPFDATNRGNFAISFLVHLAYPPVWFSLMAITSALWCVIFPGRVRGWRVAQFLTAGSGLLVAVLPVAGFVVPPLQYSARVQALYVPLILGGLAIVTMSAVRSMPAVSKERSAALWRLTATACAVAVIFHCGATVQWNRYRSVFLKELAENRGIIPYERCSMSGTAIDELARHGDWASIVRDLVEHPVPVLRPLVIAQFNWDWAMPSLSIAFSALNSESVSTIISAPDWTEWQPFDLRNPDAIPDLIDYGVPTVLGQHGSARQ